MNVTPKYIKNHPIIRFRKIITQNICMYYNYNLYICKLVRLSIIVLYINLRSFSIKTIVSICFVIIFYNKSYTFEVMKINELR